MSFHDLSATSIDGQTRSLGDYKGTVLLVVNTASECGYTPQYAGLEKLWREYKDRGFAILGFPSNDFGAQEPLDEKAIQSFCDVRYGVTFPLFAKVSTKGNGQSPVYRFLSADWGEPKWNFHKYLVGRNGQVLHAFLSEITPESPTLRGAIENALRSS